MTLMKKTRNERMEMALAEFQLHDGCPGLEDDTATAFREGVEYADSHKATGDRRKELWEAGEKHAEYMEYGPFAWEIAYAFCHGGEWADRNPLKKQS